MASDAAFALLKTDLGFIGPEIPADVQTLMRHKLDAALARLTDDGIEIDENRPGDRDLLIMYAAYLYRRRDSNEAMPRSLRLALNDAKMKAVSSP